MRKTFMGVRLRRFREERAMTQLALARALAISPSYLNQIEQNQRPLTIQVLLKLHAVFGVDVQLFSEDDEARLLADLKDAFTDVPTSEAVSATELRELVSSMPALGRAVVSLHRRYRDALERSEALLSRLGDDARALGPSASRMPHEEVRDFFYARHNYVAELDEAAERIYHEAGLSPGGVGEGLAERLEQKHGVRVMLDDPEGDALVEHRRFEASSRVLRLSAHLRPGQRAFQMATQVAFLELGEVIRSLVAGSAFSCEEARSLARIGLANHFAGALLLPYGLFLETAESLRYDVERLGRRFGVGFETTCHRLSTLQRPDAPGVPFFFVRVDRAGNISKRQSATDFHFSRLGGTCPLWNVYEAFERPGHVLAQITRMPDGRSHLWIARTVSRGDGGYGTPSKTFAVGLGCDLRHASRLVYAKGLDLSDPDAATPIGAGCKVCERTACPQRAFPPIGRALVIDENASRFTPYAVE